MEEKEIYESTDINKDESLDDIYQKFLSPESPKKNTSTEIYNTENDDENEDQNKDIKIVEEKNEEENEKKKKENNNNNKNIILQDNNQLHKKKVNRIVIGKKRKRIKKNFHSVVKVNIKAKFKKKLKIIHSITFIEGNTRASLDSFSDREPKSTEYNPNQNMNNLFIGNKEDDDDISYDFDSINKITTNQTLNDKYR